jgi:hypothetical protein
VDQRGRVPDLAVEPARALCVQPEMDDIEREAIRAEGLDPDDPAVLAALVRLELALDAAPRSPQVRVLPWALSDQRRRNLMQEWLQTDWSATP